MTPNILRRELGATAAMLDLHRRVWHPEANDRHRWKVERVGNRVAVAALQQHGGRVGLASADPTEEGTQLTNEIAYTGYARVAVARSAAGWTVSGNSVVPFAAITFPPCTALTATATFFTVGASAAGAGMLLYGGAISPSIAIANGVTPQLSVATSITES
jgi:hypothetical protein